MKEEFYHTRGKRLFDLILTLGGTPVAAMLIAILSVLSLCCLGSPIFFRQRRPGRGGKSFEVYKFRSMTDARDAEDRLLPDSMRLTQFGRFLRTTSLDELPELFNVLKGDMSLVGPRPLLLQYLDRYTTEQKRRHEVKPGITGWAQVNGRNALSWEDKFKLDVWYVDHRSLCLDLRIIAMTFKKVIRREGINQPGQATMQEFMGE